MKKYNMLLAKAGVGLVALFITMVISCKGPEGSQGLPGPQGTTGQTGSTGPQGVSGVAGPMGNANVVYTAWKPVDVSSGGSQSPDNLYVFLDNTRTAASSLLTQDVMDKSLVYVYFKTGQLVYDNANGAYTLVERVKSGGSDGYLKIPGRTKSNSEDYFYYSVGQPNMGVNYLPFSIILYTHYFNSNVQRTALPELAGKSVQFFRDMLKDVPQYRIVIVNGSVIGGRQSAINYKDYAAVKQAYNLPD